MGAKPESQDLSIQLLSLNSEFPAGVMQFHLNTDSPSSRCFSPCKVTVGMPRVEEEETEETDVDFGTVLKN